SNPAGIVRVYRIDRTTEGRAFIVMELLEGQSLAEVIRHVGALEPRYALGLASQIAQTLAATSRGGVVHRNLKRQNVTPVCPDERVKLAGFGVGRLRQTALGGRPIGPDVIASPYTAPELIQGGDVSEKTDMYALGAILYTMLTGSAPPTGPGRGPGES